MKHAGKRFSVLISLLLALVTLFSLTAEAVDASAYSASKTAEWTDTDKTKLDIKIEAQKTANSGEVPTILFVGTLCDAHDLEMNTLWTALVATAQYGNVDCYLYGNGWTGGEQEKYLHANIPYLKAGLTDSQKLAAVEQSKTSYSVKNEEKGTYSTGSETPLKYCLEELVYRSKSWVWKNNEWQEEYKDVTGLVTGQHASVYDFAELMAGFEKDGTQYDYVVMEFDGLRLGHTEYDCTDDDEKNLVSASEWIAPYYSTNSIAWIIPEKNHVEEGKTACSDDHPSSYGENKYMYNEYFFDHTQGSYYEEDLINVRNCIWLLAPEDLTTDKQGNKSVSAGIENQKNFIARATDTNANTGIWVTYDDAENVKVFLEKRLAKYSVTIQDTVASGLTVTGVSGEFTEDGGETWTAISNGFTGSYGKKNTDGSITSGSKNLDGTTSVLGTFDLKTIYGTYSIDSGHDVRLVINCKLDQTDSTESAYKFTSSNSYTIDTNVGDAVVTTVNATQKITEEVETPQVDRYTIVYDLAGGSLETGKINPEVYASSDDDITLNNPTKDGYTFKGWTGGVVGEADEVTENDSVTIASGSTGNRKYTAEWETVPSSTIVKSAQVSGNSVADKSVNAGTTVTYSVTVTNTHASASTKFEVEDQLPTGLGAVTSNISDGGTCTDNKITWPAVTLAAGASKTYTYDVTFPDSITADSAYMNTAKIVKADDKDYPETDPSASVTVTSVPKVKVKVTKVWSDGWDEHSSEKVYVNLYANGTYREQYTLDKDNPSKEVSLDALDASGNKITYTLKEAKAAGSEEGYDSGYDTGTYKITYSGDLSDTEIRNEYYVKPSEIEIEKEGPTDSVKPGEDYTYTLTVTNNNRHSATASNMVIEDEVPSGLTIKSTDPTTSVVTSGRKVTWTIASLEAGKSATLKITVSVPKDSTTATYKNTATLTSLNSTDLTGDDRQKSNEVSTDVKVSVTYAFVGAYPAGATLPTETDQPVGTEYTAKAGPTVSGYTFDGWYTDEKCTTKYTKTQLTDDLTLYGKYTPAADYTVEKSADKTDIKSGETVTFTVKVTNNNTAADMPITLVDEVPAGLIVDENNLNGGTYDKTQGTITWTATVAKGSEYSVTYKATAPTNITQTTTYTNTAYVSKAFGVDKVKPSTPASETVTVTPQVVITVEKSWSDGWEKHQSDTVTVNLYSKDTSAANAEEKLVQSFELSYSKQSDTVTLPYVGEDGQTPITYTVYEMNGDEKLNAGEFAGDFKVSYTSESTAATATANATMTFKVSNDNAVKPEELKLGKTGKSASDETGKTAQPGEEYTYTITVKNNNDHSTAAKDVVIEDVVPVGLKNISASADNGKIETSTTTGGKTTVTWTIANLPAGDTATLTVKATVPEGVSPGAFTNKATLKSLDGSDKIPEDYENPSWTFDVRTFTVVKEWMNADGSAMKDTSGMPSVEIVLMQGTNEYAKQTLSYDAKAVDKGWSYTFKNLPLKDGDGNYYVYTVKEAAVTGYTAVVSPEKPDRYTSYATVTNTADTRLRIEKVWSDGWENHKNDTVYVNLYRGIGSASYEFYQQYALTYEQQYLTFDNLPSVTSDGKHINYDACEATAEGSESSYVNGATNEYGYAVTYSKDKTGTPIVCTITNTYVVQPKDLTVTKTGSGDAVEPGDSYTYTVKVKNNRTSENEDAKKVVITDTVPDGLTIDTAKTTADAGKVTVSGQTVTWTMDSLAHGAEATLTVAVTVPEGSTTGTYTNTAKLTSLNDKTVPDDDENQPKSEKSFDVKVSVTYYFEDKDGNVLTEDKYPEDAKLPTESEALKVGTEYTALKDITESDAATVNGYDFVGWYTDEACTKKYDDKTPLTENLKLYGKLTPAADYTVSKTADKTAVGSGDTVTFTVKVTNNNTAADMPITLVDEVPAGLIVDENNLNGGTYDKTQGTITWTATVAKGSEYSVTYQAKVPTNITQTTEYTNKAYVSKAFGVDKVKPSTPASETVTVTPQVVISVEKTWSDGWDKHDETVKVNLYSQVEGGEEKLEKEFTLSKTSPKSESVTLPKFDEDGKAITYTVYEMNGDTKLNAGEFAGDFKVSYTSESAAATASANATMTFKVSNDNAVKPKELVLGKTGKSASDETGKTVQPGENYTYTLTVKNNNKHSTAAQNVVIEDEVPEGLTITSPTSGTNGVVIDGQKVTWTIASLAAGDTASLEIVVTVPADASAVQYTNKATLKSLDGDNDIPDNDKPTPPECTFDSRTFKVTKEWYNSEGTRVTGADTENLPEITVVLLQNGKEFDHSCTLKYAAADAEYGWSYTFKNLPMKDAEGNPYVYSVQEITVANYSSSITYTNGTSTAAAADTYAVIKNTSGVVITYNTIGTQPSGTRTPASEKQATGKPYNASTDYGTNSEYTFSGWYTDKNFTEKYEDGTVLTKNLDLYCKWTPVSKSEVTKSVQANSTDAEGQNVNANSTVTYTIKVKNDHTVETMDFKVVDQLPSGLTILENTISDDGVYSSDAGTITWTLTIAAGMEKEVTFNATVPSTISTRTGYTNEAYVSETKLPGDETWTTYDGGSDKDDPDDVTFTGVPRKEIIVTKTWSDNWDAHANEKVYINIYNGDTKVQSVELTKDEPSKSVKVDAVDEDNNPIEYTFKEEETVPVKYTDVASGGMNGDYKVTITPSGSLLATTVTVANDYMIKPADFEFKKTAVTAAKAGEPFAYTITVKNTRSYETATGVKVEDVLPEGLKLVVNNPNCPVTKGEGDNLEKTSAENEPERWVWTIASIGPGQTATLTFYVTVPGSETGAEYVNKATILEIGGTECKHTDSPEAKTTVRSFTVTKVWQTRDGEKMTTDLSNQPAVTVQLKRNNENCGEPVKLNSSNNWTYTWEKLDLKDDKGATYSYTVEEAEVEGYTNSTAYSHPDGFTYGDDKATITNKKKAVVVSYDFVGEDQPEGVEEPESETEDYGTEYNSQDEPTTDGDQSRYYTFEGWYLDEECTIEYEDGMILEDDNEYIHNGSLLLYGKWTRKTVTVTIVTPDDGPDITYPDPYVVNEGDQANPPELEDPDGDYEFVGYYLDPEHTIEFTNPILDDENCPDGTLTLYPLWEEKPDYRPYLLDYDDEVPSFDDPDPVEEDFNPNTGDDSRTALWGVLAGASVVGVAGTVFVTRRRKKSGKNK